MPTFKTTCIDWEDGEWDTDAPDMFAAAESHALEGWMNNETEGPECVTVLARESSDDPWGVIVVVGSEDHAWAAPAPPCIIRGLEATGQLDDAKRSCS